MKPDTPIFRKDQDSNSANLSREQILVSRKPRRTKHATDGYKLVDESPEKYVFKLELQSEMEATLGYKSSRPPQDVDILNFLAAVRLLLDASSSSMRARSPGPGRTLGRPTTLERTTTRARMPKTARTATSCGALKPSQK